jgi:hypothetical protein
MPWQGAAVLGRQGRWGFVPAALFALLVFALLIPFARLDFDPHHDGYMLAVAIAVRDGLHVHSQVFAQYGPVTPWLQGLALHLPFGPALDLRILNAAFIALGVFLLAESGRVTPKHWPITRAAGWWAAIAWTLVADVWLYVPMLPWSSTIAAFESILLLTLVSRGLRQRDLRQMTRARLDFCLAGALLPVLFFTRINVAVATILGLALVILVAGLPAIRRIPSLTLAGLAGFGVSALAFAIALVMTQAWPSFIDQAILYPFGYHVGEQASNELILGLASALAQQWVPIALICAAIVLQRRLSVPRLQVLIGLGAGAGIVIWENRRLVTEPSVDGWLGRILTPNNIFLTGTQPNFQYLYLFMALYILFTLGLTGAATTRLIRTGSLPPLSVRWGIIIILASAGLVQTFPLWDPRHIWWGLPIALLLVFAVLKVVSPRPSWGANPLLIPMLAIAIMACFSGWNNLRIDRVDASRESVTENMRLNRDLADSLDRNRAFLEDNLPQDEPAIYITQDGAYAVLRDSFNSADPYFVGWGPVPGIEQRVQENAPIVLQRGWAQNTWQARISPDLNYRSVASNDVLIIYRFRD